MGDIVVHFTVVCGRGNTIACDMIPPFRDIKQSYHHNANTNEFFHESTFYGLAKTTDGARLYQCQNSHDFATVWWFNEDAFYAFTTTANDARFHQYLNHTNAALTILPRRRFEYGSRRVRFTVW